MAVYTKINKKDISYINRKFKIERIIKFQGIKQGIENTNYLLKSKKKQTGRYVLSYDHTIACFSEFRRPRNTAIRLLDQLVGLFAERSRIQTLQQLVEGKP